MGDDDHLHSIIADYGDACAEMQAELDRLRAELAAEDKRFDYAVEAVDLKDKELIQERTLARDLRKRVGELEGLFSHVGVETHKWFDPECGHEGCQSLVLKARAEQAEAQLAEAKARIAELENKNSYNLQIVREATARIAELEHEFAPMREALELVLKYAHAWLVPSSLADVARAALAPSPAGREERHEMTGIGDKEPD